MYQDRPVILMVEDEDAVLQINARMMRRRGYEVRTAGTCREARELLVSDLPDLLILDIMLPDGSGFELCDQFRRVCNHPVIFLTGKSETGDKVEGLGRGGDYYLTKPYDMDELLAVADRLMQRHLQTSERQEQLTVIRRGALTLDIPRARAAVDGKDAALTAKEFALLLLLVQNEEHELSPQTLYETVWGTRAENDTRTVRFHIANLRRKLQAEEARDFDIVSSYGKGYLFTTFR